MSRFLAAYRRLTRKVSALEAAHSRGDLGAAMREYHITGTWPRNKGLFRLMKRHLDAAQAMANTLPGPGPEEDKQ